MSPPKTFRQMFIAVLYIISQTWKQPRCPSIGEWINKLWYIQTMGCSSTLKKKWAIKPWKDVEEMDMHITKWKKPIWKGYILIFVMVNFTCQLDWATENPDIWSNSSLVFLDEIIIWTGGLSKEDCPPQCAWASSNSFWAWI